MSRAKKIQKETTMNKLLSTYGLTREPFTKDIAPSEMFQTEQLQEALQSLKAAIEGQTSIGMGLEPHSSFAALHCSVSQHIQELASQHKLRVIIVLDEAHLLAIQVLEQLHILANFEKDSKPWLSIILIGLPDLRETLKRNVLASLTARVPIRVQIPPLDADQVKLYIRHRMSIAGCRRDIFSDDALLLMSKATGGIMRRLDVLGEQCLVTALKTKSNIVDAAVVQKAIQSCGDALL